jgi:hypothetical protein
MRDSRYRDAPFPRLPRSAHHQRVQHETADKSGTLFRCYNEAFGVWRMELHPPLFVGMYHFLGVAHPIYSGGHVLEERVAPDLV